MSKDRKNPNGAGTDARKRADGRYETRATLDTPTGRRQVSFYGHTAKEANDAKFAALADQSKGVLFSDPNASPSQTTWSAGFRTRPATR